MIKNAVFDNHKISKKRQKFNSRLHSMEVEVGLAPFKVYKEFLCCYWVYADIFNQSRLKKLILGNF